MFGLNIILIKAAQSFHMNVFYLLDRLSMVIGWNRRGAFNTSDKTSAVLSYERIIFTGPPEYGNRVDQERHVQYT